jgi:predicted ester cyclase
MSNLFRHLAPGLALIACAPAPAPSPAKDGVSSANPTERAMTPTATEANKRVVHRLFHDGMNQGRFELVEQLIAPSFVGATGERGPSAFVNVVAGLRAAFPDIHYTLDDVIAEGDRVVVRWTWTGTHRNAYRGFETTNKRVKNTAIAIFELEGEKLTRAWLENDRLGFLQAMGAVPEGLGGPPPKVE